MKSGQKCQQNLVIRGIKTYCESELVHIHFPGIQCGCSPEASKHPTPSGQEATLERTEGLIFGILLKTMIRTIEMLAV